jgi:hypothetical protein
MKCNERKLKSMKGNEAKVLYYEIFVKLCPVSLNSKHHKISSSTGKDQKILHKLAQLWVKLSLTFIKYVLVGWKKIFLNINVPLPSFISFHSCKMDKILANFCPYL